MDQAQDNNNSDNAVKGIINSINKYMILSYELENKLNNTQNPEEIDDLTNRINIINKGINDIQKIIIGKITNTY